MKLAGEEEMLKQWEKLQGKLIVAISFVYFNQYMIIQQRITSELQIDYDVLDLNVHFEKTLLDN